MYKHMGKVIIELLQGYINHVRQQHFSALNYAWAANPS